MTPISTVRRGQHTVYGKSLADRRSDDRLHGDAERLGYLGVVTLPQRLELVHKAALYPAPGAREDTPARGARPPGPDMAFGIRPVYVDG